MRYFLLGFVLLCALFLSVAGLRFDHGGRISRRPPIEVFPDMDRQPKLRPQAPNNFFGDQLSSRLPVEGTVARGQPASVDGRDVFHFEDHPYNTGRVTGQTNFIDTLPVPITEQLLARGQERFNIYCTPCHGAGGDGKGVTTRLGMTVIRDLHLPQVVSMPDGQLFHTITYGFIPLMGGYAAQIDVKDRWAIVAYVRALQRSRLATLDEVPEALRGSLKK
jgi:mono/diheme cytochrome c family protein